MAGKAFTFDDIVADAVKKQLMKTGGAGGGGFMDMLGVKDIKDITNLINAIQNLVKMQNQIVPKVPPQPQKAPISESAPAPASPTMAINPETVFNGLVSVMDGLMTIGGDMKLSEAKQFLTDHKTDIIPLIQGQLAAVNVNAG